MVNNERVFQRGAPTRRGTPTYYLAKICRKLHERRKLDRGVGGASKILLYRSATVYLFIYLSHFVLYFYHIVATDHKSETSNNISPTLEVKRKGHGHSKVTSPRPGSGSNSTVTKVNGSLLHNRDPIYNYHRKEKRRVRSFFCFRVRLHQASASTLRELCEDTSNRILIESNGVTQEWAATHFQDSIVFNENRIASVITEFSQR